jgi:hypothetical protein
LFGVIGLPQVHWAIEGWFLHIAERTVASAAERLNQRTEAWRRQVSRYAGDHVAVRAEVGRELAGVSSRDEDRAEGREKVKPLGFEVDADRVMRAVEPAT